MTKTTPLEAFESVLNRLDIPSLSPPIGIYTILGHRVFYRSRYLRVVYLVAGPRTPKSWRWYRHEVVFRAGMEPEMFHALMVEKLDWWRKKIRHQRTAHEHRFYP